MSEHITASAPAKINAFLSVGPARSDGFHGLSTVFVALDLAGTVEVEFLAGWGADAVTADGPFAAGVPTDSSNLAARALAALKKRCEETGRTAWGSAVARLTKNVPAAGGMAGGSADAAAALRAGNAYLERRGAAFDEEELRTIAASLGSDVPFALLGGAAAGSGRGERLTPIDAPHEFRWIAVPHQVSLPTPGVFARLDEMRAAGTAPQPVRGRGEAARALKAGDPERLGAALANDLAAPAMELRPGIAHTLLELRQLPGVTGVVVSGSGPTVVALLAGEEEQQAASEALRSRGVEHLLAAGPAPGARVIGGEP